MIVLKTKFKGLQNEPPYGFITDRPTDRIPEAFGTVTEISKIVLENLTLDKIYRFIFNLLHIENS